MARYELIATAAFGIESVVADELRALGYKDLKIEDGRVSFSGDDYDIVRCNLWLRSADRVLLKMAEFQALDFEDLFQGTLAVRWEDLIPEKGKMHVTGKSVRSKLYSVPDCQSIVKKAVVEAMKRKYRRTLFEESGPVYKIEVGLLRDTVTLTVDTSGAGLHKRGYRLEKGEAPLRETLAAAVISLSRWRPDRLLADPMCGSGTIPIEAALIGRNRAPGLDREFAAESWPHIPVKVWGKLRAEAREQINRLDFKILASDRDFRVFAKARENAERAGVAENIIYQKKPLEEFSSKKKYGCIVCNPPYGERLGEEKEVEELYKTMGRVFSTLDTWSVFVLSGHPDFQKLYGQRSSKNRKLYNGRLQCYLYQYWGPLPPRRKVGGDESAEE